MKYTVGQKLWMAPHQYRAVGCEVTVESIGRKYFYVKSFSQKYKCLFEENVVRSLDGEYTLGYLWESKEAYDYDLAVEIARINVFLRKTRCGA